MAYIKRFSHDIFISYAHNDNTPEREGMKGWVECFEHQLSIRLLKRFGEPVDIWRDRELGRAQLLDPAIERAVQGACIIIPLLSSRYLKSNSCKKEIEWFCTYAQQERIGLTVGDALRLFPVLLYNIPPKDWPDACQGVSAFPFHDAQGNEYGEPLDPDSEAFSKQLRGLVEELSSVMTRLREQEVVQEQSKPQEAEDQESSFKVFVAHPADNLRPIRRRLIAELKSQGMNIFGDIPPPYEEGPHAGAVSQALQQADLSIHLLSDLPGEPLDSDIPGKTFPMEQARLGQEHSRSQLILIPDEFKVEDITEPSYAEFMRTLRQQSRAAAHLEIVQTDRSQMLHEILAKQQKLKERAARLKGEREVAFIDLHINDVSYATELVGYLSQHKITPVMIPASDLTPASSMALFEENLKRSNLFIVVFGTVARPWVEHRLNEAFKLILINQLLTRIGIYVAPPRKPQAEVKFSRSFDVMINMERFDPYTLQGLLKNLAVGEV